MGLDMHLIAKKYVGGWKHTRESASPDDKKEVSLYDRLIEATGITPDEDSPSFYVHANVGYWRKANAIHAWFVANVQDGKDDCHDSYVSRKHLEELRGICRKVLSIARVVDGKVANGSVSTGGGPFVQQYEDGRVIENAQEVAVLLPSQSGFFFGPTDYDEWYLKNVEQTVAIIDRVLSDPALESCDFEYHASW